MTFDDEFTPKLGKPRARGGRLTAGRRYLNHVRKATNLARGSGPQVSKSGRSSSFDGSRIGRGSGVGRVLSTRAGAEGYRQRRVIVKARIVKLAGKGMGVALAHMRYIQRDGVTREGLPGELYSAQSEKADGREFMERADGDRHQFRFIVSPEDGQQYDDLRDVTRRLMAKMKQDLDTKLDWVAVDHYNTGHPHTHIIVRGRDDQGKDLIIAKEYITSGIRERAIEIVSLDLGPRLDSEIDASLKAEMTQDRFTSLDANLLRSRDENGIVRAVDPDGFRQSLMAGRLQKLEALGLAEKTGTASWQLADDIEPTLRRMGERGDIIKTMAHDLKRSGLGHALSEAVIHEHDSGKADASQKPDLITGQVIKRGFSDELNDRYYIIVDATDGRLHYVEIGTGEATEPLPTKAIVRLEHKVPAVTRADQTIADVAAANGGHYDIDAHLKHDRTASQSYAETHVRRLEAIRRATGAVDRAPQGTFHVGQDYLKAALDYERRLATAAPVKIEVLSSVPLEQLASRNAVTWLDRELKSSEPTPCVEAGFGASVSKALCEREQWLIKEGLATSAGDGTVNYAPNLTATLAQRDVRAAGGQLSKELGLNFVEPRNGEMIEGTVRRSIDLTSGKYALIEKSREFALVPWRDVLRRQIGKEVSGIVREGDINWSRGRNRGLEIE